MLLKPNSKSVFIKLISYRFLFRCHHGLDQCTPCICCRNIYQVRWFWNCERCREHQVISEWSCASLEIRIIIGWTFQALKIKLPWRPNLICVCETDWSNCLEKMTCQVTENVRHRVQGHITNKGPNLVDVLFKTEWKGKLFFFCHTLYKREIKIGKWSS